MSYTPHKGSCLLIPFNDVPHLFVVLNDPCLDGYCILVMLTSIKPSKPHDDACTFVGGEHPFINKPSFVLYRLAEQVQARRISKMVGMGYYKEKDPLALTELERVIEGLFTSEDSRQRMINYAKSIGL